ncbi:LysR substrate-binding domain-containing protein [Microbacterium sp. KUDC0406]|uniref:LysR substrate-binding domain-containing protein n=1 Tax=Microbacterium sp. KUDC0406 TaxID=2909588 RepID=UPI001F1DEAF9|nr:LysR substrate-binding domain-containing protein [Microbacterium sp. KUDC0406]UJP10216.1 LysR substrate-binding domain-containing protein [Microbacterium sp. KUDC0406]
MAKKSGRPAPGKRPSGGRGKPAVKKAAPAKRPSGKKAAPAEAIDETPRTFRLGAIPGATPGKWIDAWKSRMPHVTLELVPIEVAEERTALADLDAALVRLPIDRPDDLHVIRLYDELPVVVASDDSHLMAAETLTAADLDGEVLVTPLDDVLGPLALSTVAPRFAPVATTEDAIATVATGTGIVVVPMSLARLHHRKDADHRVLEGGPTSTVALAWPRERTTPDVEAFVGIVRGRTANSSR